MPHAASAALDFSSAVAESVRASGGDAAAWGERVGWDVEPLLRDPEEIRATLIELGLANVEVRAGGNGVEARALGSAGERRGSGREVSVRFAHAPEAA